MNYDLTDYFDFSDKYQYHSGFYGLIKAFTFASSNIHSTESYFLGTYFSASSSLGGEILDN